MDRIVAIIDMDGFRVKKKFLCKELGILKVGDKQARSFFFDIGIKDYSQLDPKDRRTCRFVSKHIHKLPLGVPPFCKHAIPLCHLDNIIRRFYNACRIGENSTIAYKGGDVERELLDKLNIPSVNLEDFKCPKADLLFSGLKDVQTCGNHIEPNAYRHCPKVEVEAFGYWLKGRLLTME